jgi:pimeloyl-ACP methyl ester carboxylesterase
MSAFSKIWKAAAIAGGAGVAAMAAMNASIRRNAAEPDDSIMGGDPGIYEWVDGDVHFQAAGEVSDCGPVVLVHGLGAGSSGFTWRKNFASLSQRTRVYAPDLLGFGFSAKPGVSYDAPLFVELLEDFLQEVSGPAHVVAASLSAAYAVHAAARQPGFVKSLTLISPTGTATQSSRPGVTGAAFYGLMNSPVLGTSFYNVFTSERSIRDFARQQYFYDRRRVTDRFVAHHYAVSHQPGAQHAIAAYLSGYLNTDARADFAGLTQPITMVWGKQDETNPLVNAGALLQLNPRVRLEIFDRCRMSPPEEHPEKFNELVQSLIRPRGRNVVDIASAQGA